MKKNSGKSNVDVLSPTKSVGIDNAKKAFDSLSDEDRKSFLTSLGVPVDLVTRILTYQTAVVVGVTGQKQLSWLLVGGVGEIEALGYMETAKHAILSKAVIPSPPSK